MREALVSKGRRRSRAEAQQLVAEYEAGRASRVEFCRTHELALATLARYLRRRRPRPEAAPAPAGSGGGGRPVGGGGIGGRRQNPERSAG